MAQHDESYKLIFSYPEMVRDLILDCVKQRWIESVDFSTLETVKGSYISYDLREREDDIIWRVKRRRKDGQQEWLYLYLLIEFQSTVDPFMAVRLMVYIGLLYQDIIRQNLLGADRKLPPVFPLVLYNGEDRWTAAMELSELVEPVDEDLQEYVPHLKYHLLAENSFTPEEMAALPKDGVSALFQLENSRNPEEIQKGLNILVEWLQEPGRQELARAFLVWLQRVLLPRKTPGVELPEVQTLQEANAMLAERVKQWDSEGYIGGLQTGLEQGRRELLLQLIETKFGPLPEDYRQRVAVADRAKLLEWGEALLRASQLEDVFK